MYPDMGIKFYLTSLTIANPQGSQTPSLLETGMFIKYTQHSAQGKYPSVCKGPSE